MRSLRAALRNSSASVPDDSQGREEHIRGADGPPTLGAITVHDGIILKVHPESRVAFEYFCDRSPEMIAEMDAFIAATSKKMRLLDVGALHGLFSLVFAVGHPNRRVIAVDASPIAFARLLYNIHKNTLENVEAFEYAMSDDVGALAMHYEWEHVVAAGTDTTNKAIEVEMTTGDVLCENAEFRPDVIKIDVEGHEVSVLRGLTRTIDAYRPVIFLEVHPSRMEQEGHGVGELEEFFCSRGYAARHVEGAEAHWASVAKVIGETRLILEPFGEPVDEITRT
jgi:FkbM family methyltransferase